MLDEPGDDKTPIVAAHQPYKKPQGGFQKKPYQKGQPRGPTNYEDDQDEPDPEWLDEAVEKEEKDEEVYFKRRIQDEDEIRARFTKTITPVAYEDVEDALDELI